MSDLERAKLIPVAGNNDTPDMNNAIDVQFNPLTLKVNLANTLKANPSQGNSRATQFVDKSSSTLTVELLFDTTYIEAAGASGQGGDSTASSNRNQIEQGADVRSYTKKIADKFIKPVASGSQMQAPSRVLFQWGSFEFVGMVQSYDETLDFFSPKGRPLRATVALKLSEDRYQFRSNDSAARAAAQTPSLSLTGNGAGAKEPGGGSDAGNGALAANQQLNPVPGSSRDGAGGWRENAMFNGIESPRLPAVSALALPSVGLNASAGIGAALNSGPSASPAAGAGPATAGTSGPRGTQSPGSSVAAATTPAFKYGNSAALGTGIPGAFSPLANASLKAASLQQGSQQLRPAATAGAAPGQSSGSAAGAQGIDHQRSRPGIAVAALLQKVPDSGVGFD